MSKFNRFTHKSVVQDFLVFSIPASSNKDKGYKESSFAIRRTCLRNLITLLVDGDFQRYREMVDGCEEPMLLSRSRNDVCRHLS